MELIVGALVVLGFGAILIRFLPRDATGRAMLPRIVDDSIGMWVLRSIRDRVRSRRSPGRVPGRRPDPTSAIAASDRQRFATTTARLAAAGVPRAPAPTRRPAHRPTLTSRLPRGRRLRDLVAPTATALTLLIIALVAVASALTPGDAGRRPVLRQTPDPARSPAPTRPAASASTDGPPSPERATARP